MSTTPLPAALAPHPLLAAFRSAASQRLVIDDVHTAPLAEPAAAGDMATVDELFQTFFTSSPPWLVRIMRIRNAIVGRLGFETGAAGPPQIPDHPAPGDEVGAFTVLERSDAEIVFGGDDKHMSLRISIAAARGAVSLGTAAHNNSSLGRAYLALVNLFHGPVAALVAKRCARQVRTDG